MKGLLQFLLAALPLVFAADVFSQKIEYPERFQNLLSQAGIEFFEPVEGSYRDVQVPENQFQNCDFAIRSNKEDLQIRFCILPWNESDPLSMNPHVATGRMVAAVATNVEIGLISRIQPDPESLRKDFNADWGKQYFFQPKPGFSEKLDCRMVALHKEGKGTAFIFYLFDDPGNEALDVRYLALKFQ